MSDLNDTQQFEEEILKADLEEALTTEVENEDTILEGMVEKENLSSRAWNALKGTLRLFKAFGDEIPEDVIEKIAPQSKYVYEYGDVKITKEEVDAYLEATETAECNVDKAEKPTKSEGGRNFFASDYAYVPDPQKPSTWKLRLTNTPGGAPDPRIVGAAVAALGKGFRGQKVQLPAADRGRVRARVRAAWLKANPEKSREDLPNILKSDTEEKPMADEKTALEEEVQKGELEEEQTPKSEEVEKAKVSKQPPMPSEEEEEEEEEKMKKAKMKKADEASEEVTISKADYEKQQKEIAAIRKEQAETKAELEAERKARANEKAIAKAAEDYPNLPVKSDELGPMVQAVHEALTKEQAETFERILKAADEAIAATKAFEDAKGGSFQLSEAGSAYARIKEIAKSIVEKSENGMTEAQAFVRATEENPRLYDEYLAETRG